MFPGDFIELLQRKPFQPLRLRLSNGLVYDIRHPELAIVRPSVVWLEFPPQTLPVPLVERRVQVEVLTDQQTPSVN